LDGSGYPRGLRAEQISLEARMMTVADIYDALTASDRPYKKAMPPERALQILRDEAAQGQLDSDLVELFITHEVYKRIEGGPSITASKNLLKIGIKWRGKTTK
jgi:HD-GYP domain-containing protein (c-di-GMP phosphodiesterase class II)